jgi:hypothetical protein
VQKVQQGPTSSFVNIAGNARTAAISAIHIISDGHAINVIATDRRHPKVARADSESQTLAIKKFCAWGGRVSPALAKNRIFGRIAATDSQARSGRDDEFSEREERSTRACEHRSRRRQRCRRPVTGRFQVPSFVLSRTLTAFGSTLPPDAFMT